MFDELNLAQKLAVWTLPVLLAITVHEVAHGRVARLLGDDTAERAGRLSLNPLRHVDPIGTLLVPAILLLLPGSFLFGWAKPVPVDWRKLRNPRRDMAWVAVAGPASNAVMALGWGLLLKLALGAQLEGPVWSFAGHVALAGISINLVLMVLNLLPIPPLDGGRVLAGVLPLPAASLLARIEPWGLFIMLGLMVAGLLGPILSPMVSLAAAVLLRTLGIDPRALF